MVCTKSQSNVSAKFCSVPPHPPSGGSVTVTSDGYMFGHNCSTAGYETVPGNGSCDTELNLENSAVVGNFREAFKSLHVIFFQSRS